jgi:hypothetical protein
MAFIGYRSCVSYISYNSGKGTANLCMCVGIRFNKMPVSILLTEVGIILLVWLVWCCSTSSFQWFVELLALLQEYLQVSCFRNTRSMSSFPDVAVLWDGRKLLCS